MKTNKKCEKLEAYYWLKEKGICVSCRREDAQPNRILCFECNEKKKKRSSEYYKKNISKKKKSDKERYLRSKENGICTCCGMRKISRNSGIYCLECYVRKKRIKAEKNRGNLDRSERPKYRNVL